MLNVRTNDLVRDKTSMRICNYIINLTSFIKDAGVKVVIFLIAPYNERAKTVSVYLINIFESVGVSHTRQENIQPDFHLIVAKLHLNKKTGNFYLEGYIYVSQTF